MKTYQTEQKVSDADLSGTKYQLAPCLQDTVFNTKTITGTCSSVEEFINKNQPIKISKNLLNAIKKAFNNNSTVTFNAGKGNQTFYFYE